MTRSEKNVRESVIILIVERSPAFPSTLVTASPPHPQALPEAVTPHTLPTSLFLPVGVGSTPARLPRSFLGSLTSPCVEPFLKHHGTQGLCHVV